MTAQALYNEIDPFAAQWLRNLAADGHIAEGGIDERSIRDLSADDVAGDGQRHFFAGIGVWSHALRLAGWPDDRPVWTGSCPCQPFASARRGRGGGFGSTKDLWPTWLRLIDEVRPPVVFGEQVAKGDGGRWLDRTAADFERMGFAFWSARLCASTVGSPRRDRFFFVAYSHGFGECDVPVDAEMAELAKAEGVARVDWRSLRGVVPPSHGHPARMGRLRALGNAINPAAAAAFVSAFMRSTPRPKTDEEQGRGLEGEA